MKNFKPVILDGVIVPDFIYGLIIEEGLIEPPGLL